MKNKDTMPRREFLRNAVMLAGAGITAPLWAAMKYDKNAVTLVPGQPRTFVFAPYDNTTSPHAFKAAFSVTHLADLCK